MVSAEVRTTRSRLAHATDPPLWPAVVLSCATSWLGSARIRLTDATTPLRARASSTVWRRLAPGPARRNVPATATTSAAGRPRRGDQIRVFAMGTGEMRAGVGGWVGRWAGAGVWVWGAVGGWGWVWWE